MINGIRDISDMNLMWVFVETGWVESSLILPPTSTIHLFFTSYLYIITENDDALVPLDS